MIIPPWIWWTAYALVGVHLLFQIRRVRRGAEVQVPAFYQFFGMTASGMGAQLMVLAAVLLYAAMGVIFYVVLH